jgi:hypothetical protein
MRFSELICLPGIAFPHAIAPSEYITRETGIPFRYQVNIILFQAAAKILWRLLYVSATTSAVAIRAFTPLAAMPTYQPLAFSALSGWFKV